MKRRSYKGTVLLLTILMAAQAPLSVPASAGQGEDVVLSETVSGTDVVTGEQTEEPAEKAQTSDAQNITDTPEVTGQEEPEETKEPETGGFEPGSEVVPGSNDVSAETDDKETILRGTANQEKEVLYGTASGPDAVVDVAGRALDRSAAFIKREVTEPVVDSIGGEWSVLVMARYGNLDEVVKNIYLSNLYVKLQETGGLLDEYKYTEHSRVTLALTAMGVDPHNVNGYNVLAPLADFEGVKAQGINGPTYALIALDTRGFEVPSLSEEQIAEGRIQTTRENLIQALLDAELPNGGWNRSEDGTGEPDVDTTAMTMSSLAAYCDGRSDVRDAVNRGIEYLSKVQDEHGGFSSWGTPNVESTCQTAIALSAIDYTLLTDEKFTKNGNNIIDNILSFQIEDGSFSHIVGEGTDYMGTDQASQALIAYVRAAGGKTRLYDMSDVPGDNGEEEEPQENIEAIRAKIQALPQQCTIGDEQKVTVLLVELNQMKSFGEKKDFQNKLNTIIQDIGKQKAVVQQLDENIWNQIKPLGITLEDQEAVEALRKAYNALPEANRQYLKNGADLLRANSIIKKLEKKILGAEIFESVNDSKKDYIFEGGGYTVKVKGVRVYVPQDMDAEITVESSQDQWTFTTKAGGKLPGEIDFTVECAMPDGTYMLYREGSGGAQKVQWVAVRGGKVTCSITEGGTYFLDIPKEMESAQVLDGTKQTSPQSGSGSKTPAKSSGSGSGSRTAGSTQAKKKTESSDNIVNAKVESGVVKKEDFEAVKDKDKNLQIKNKNKDGKEYTLTIHGKDVKNPQDMKVGLSSKSIHEGDIKLLAENPYILHFEQEGDFPGEMQAEVSVERTDGEYMLFRFDPAERKAEYIQKVTVKEKKTKFLVSKGGTYFIDTRVKVKSLNDAEDETGTDENKDSETGAAEQEARTTLASVGGSDNDLILAGTGEPEEGSSVVPMILAVILTAAAGAYGVYLWWKMHMKPEQTENEIAEGEDETQEKETL